MIKVAGWIPVSESLLADSLPLGTYIHRILEDELLVRRFGEVRIPAMALMERGTNVWDEGIYGDEEWSGLGQWGSG